MSESAATLAAREDKEYILGTHGDELRRLGFQHQLWAEPTVRLWERAGFAPGQSLLDLGCGPGFATADLAQLVGAKGSVLGVDVSSRFLAHCQTLADARGLANVRTDVQDAMALSLPSNSLHGAFARWVLCFTPNPRAVVQSVVDALRPGGTFAVFDYIRYDAFTMAPRSKVMERVVRATDQSIRDTGGDWGICTALPEIMDACGMDLVSIEPIVRIGRPGTALWEWPATFFENYIPVLIEKGLLTEDDQHEFRAMWRERSANPSAFFTTPVLAALVGRKR